jgi:hypothetical protein
MYYLEIQGSQPWLSGSLPIHTMVRRSNWTVRTVQLWGFNGMEPWRETWPRPETIRPEISRPWYVRAPWPNIVLPSTLLSISSFVVTELKIGWIYERAKLKGSSWKSMAGRSQFLVLRGIGTENSMDIGKGLASGNSWKSIWQDEDNCYFFVRSRAEVARHRLRPNVRWDLPRSTSSLRFGTRTIWRRLPDRRMPPYRPHRAAESTVSYAAPLEEPLDLRFQWPEQTRVN